MIGAIIGDIAGSTYEFHSIKTKDFPLFAPGSNTTDDSLMSIAVASALMQTGEGGDFKASVVSSMRQIAAKYPCPMGGYGGRFRHWLVSPHPRPYGSFGNGSAMRVSPCGEVAATLDEALELAKQSAEVTHNHPEGLKGAEATAVAVFLARTGKSKNEIKDYIIKHYYPLDFTIDGIRETYQYNETCQDTVPQALEAFFESTDFEDAIRNAISIGGDSDTLAAITGSVAEAYYGVPADLRKLAYAFLDERLYYILLEFEERYPAKTEEKQGVARRLCFR